MKKLTGVLAACLIASTMAFGASAQGVADDVIDGAEDIIDGAGDAADDILGGDQTTEGDIEDDVPDVTTTPEDTTPPEDTTTPPENNDNNTGEDNTTDEGETKPEEDENPDTGIPFLPAGLVALGAAGVAYLTKKHYKENG